MPEVICSGDEKGISVPCFRPWLSFAFKRQLASVLLLQSFSHQLKQLLVPELDQRFAVDEETGRFVYTEHSAIFCVLLNVL